MTDSWPSEAFILRKMRALGWVLRGLLMAVFGFTMWVGLVLEDIALAAIGLFLLVVLWLVAVLAMTVAWLGGSPEGESNA